MNANELADELDIHVSMVGGKFFTECANMLRKQQAEIDNLAIVKYLNGVTISRLYAELDELKEILTSEGISVNQEYLDALIEERQEK